MRARHELAHRAFASHCTDTEPDLWAGETLWSITGTGRHRGRQLQIQGLDRRVTIASPAPSPRSDRTFQPSLLLRATRGHRRSWFAAKQNSMNEYPLVQITKLAATSDCLVQPGCWDTYRVGESNDTSVPVDYTVVGFLLQPIAVGLGVQLLRVERNGVSAVGMFLTSEIREITPYGFITANSVYELRLLD